MKGIIVAAGYGTRFLPVTKTVPKEMLPLINKPSIAFVVDEFVASGIDDIAAVTSRRKKASMTTPTTRPSWKPSLPVRARPTRPQP
ncbi:hypothetical protein MASR2M48_20140 [Spirochaetota bacterium]